MSQSRKESASTLWRNRKWAKMLRKMAPVNVDAQSLPQAADSAPSPPTAPDSKPPPSPPTDETPPLVSDAVLVTLEDLDHLREGLLRGALTSAWSGVPLVFTDPTAADYVRYDPDSEIGYNEGHFALDPSRYENRRFLDYYQWLLSSLAYLHSIQTTTHDTAGSIQDYAEPLMSRVRDELSRLEDIKEIEWSMLQSSNAPGRSDVPYDVVDTGAIILSIHRWDADW